MPAKDRDEITTVELIILEEDPVAERDGRREKISDKKSDPCTEIV